jgi:hypothetical protein
LIFLIFICALLITPLFIYTYNHGDVLLRQDEVLNVRAYQFKLNASNIFLEFTESIDTVESDSFVRIANISTNGVLVGINIIPEGVSEGVELQTVTNASSNPLRFEFPRENLAGFTVQLNRIAEDAVIDLSIETVRDVWVPWKDPIPYYQSYTVGLALMVIVLIFPQKSKTQLSDDIISHA